MNDLLDWYNKRDVMIYDAIVIGLGPAGAAAAYEISKSGFNVLAIEKARLPRYKPCGGGITAKIDKILESDFKEVVERTVHGICLSYRGDDELYHFSEKPICYMVMRDRFDYFLAEKATAAGAEILRERVLGVNEERGMMAVSTDSGKYYAGMIIGADGAGSTVARKLGLNNGTAYAHLVESEVRVKPEFMEKSGVAIRFDIGSMQSGYGWIFPKADHLSVGAGGFVGQGRKHVDYYADFMEKCVPDVTETLLLRRCVLPMFNRKRCISGNRCMLVGDAASLVDPFTGEGVYYAVKSAIMAAGAMADGREPCDYEAQVREEIYKEFRFAGKVGRVFYSFPKLMHGLLKEYPELMRGFVGLSRGDVSYEELWKSFWNKTAKGAFSMSGLSNVPKLLRMMV